jgi:hypothetical protein
MEDVGIFSTILSILRLNGIFYGHLVHLVHLGKIFQLWYRYYTEKNLATLVVALPCFAFYFQGDQGPML